MADTYPPSLWGITAPQFRHPSEARSTLSINSKEDDKPVTINSRDYVAASGSNIGFQCKPNTIVANTSEHTGAEISPRVTDASVGGILGLNVAPLAKTATSARTITTFKGIEINPGLPGSGSAYTVTEFDAIRVFLDKGVGHTVTETTVIRVATPNNGSFDSFAQFEANTGCISTVSAGAASSEWLLVKVGSNIRKIALLAAS